MHTKRLKINRTDILASLLYFAVIIMGVLFILDRPFVLEISFYVVGGGIIAISLYMLLSMMLQRNHNKEVLRTSYFKLSLIIMMMIGGVAVIVYSNQGISFYQDVLASIFFFRSIYRYFYAYISKKTNRNTAAIVFVVLATVGLALSAFFTFYQDSSKVIGICAGVAVILEGSYGLYRIWFPSVHQKITFPHPDNSPPHYSAPSQTEIIITNYEIVDSSKDDSK